MDNLIPTKTIKENGVIAIKNGIKPNSNKLIPIERKPTWLRVKSQNSPKYRELKEIVANKKLHTVCEEAMCPNIQECWSHGTATFMLLGSVCTRACKFCAVDTGNPKGLLDKDEPLKVANSIAHMNLKYAVLTSVNRDDLDDGGAEHFSDTVKAIKENAPEVVIEALVPDFLGNEQKTRNDKKNKRVIKQVLQKTNLLILIFWLLCFGILSVDIFSYYARVAKTDVPLL